MRALALFAVIAFVQLPATADWGHPLKWDQLAPPDSQAAATWIEYDRPSDAITADDYRCLGLATDRYVTDVEFYGFSYYGSQYIDKFRVQFWSDSPATPGDAGHPNQLLYSYDASRASPANPLKLGWQEIAGGNHFQIDLPADHWFDQGFGEKTLWLSIQGIMVTDGEPDSFYWNFRERHEPSWGSGAAFASGYFGYAPWANWGSPAGYADPTLYNGPPPADWTSLDMSFSLRGIPEPTSLLLLASTVLLLRHR